MGPRETGSRGLGQECYLSYLFPEILTLSHAPSANRRCEEENLTTSIDALISPLDVLVFVRIQRGPRGGGREKGRIRARPLAARSMHVANRDSSNRLTRFKLQYLARGRLRAPGRIFCRVLPKSETDYVLT